MKKLALFVAFIALSFAVASCTKETPTGGNSSSSNNQWEAEGVGAAVNATDIAPDIVNFVITQFPETSILSCNQTEHYYRVILSDNTKVYSPAQNAERVADHFINVGKCIRSFA